MIGLREDQQMKARIIDYLNYATGECGRGLAPDSSGPDKQMQADTPPSGASPLPHWPVLSLKVGVGSAASTAVG